MKPTGKLPVSQEQVFIVGEPNSCYENRSSSRSHSMALGVRGWLLYSEPNKALFQGNAL